MAREGVFNRVGDPYLGSTWYWAWDRASTMLGPVVKRNGEAVVMDIRDASTWPELMTPEEVAQVMRVDKAIVLAELREGRLPAVLDTPRLKRIPKWAVRGLIEPATESPGDTGD